MNEKELEKKIIDVLKSCYDPEIPVDIFELGLIYEIRIKPFEAPEIKEEGQLFKGPEPEHQNENRKGKFVVEILMTLTSPNCPVAESLPLEVENRVRGVEGLESVKVTITFDPPWEKSMMSEAAQLELGFM